MLARPETHHGLDLPEAKMTAVHDASPSTVLPATRATMAASLGRDLYPGQVEDQLAQVAALREVHALEGCNLQYRLSLPQSATGVYLEEQGAARGCTRLPAQAARVPVQFTGASQVVAPGTAWTDGQTRWVLLEPGQVPGAAVLEASETGPKVLPSGVPLVPMDHAVAATSTAEAAGGCEVETDDHYRARILLVHGTWARGGTPEGYRYEVMSAHPEVLDAGVWSPQEGQVEIIPLATWGLPGADLMTRIQTRMAAADVLALGITLTLLEPVAVVRAPRVALWLVRGTDTAAALSAAQAGVDAWRSYVRGGLGRGLYESALHAAATVQGVHHVELPGWTDATLSPRQWADVAPIVVELGGYV